eukprot:TRINITY_DN3850_c0_g1_i2.p1 TRINITY_DN3850_c0_g1~~TRINITY_DN3850_c0_g1_i2.p1  ORF type:complete len:838 (-),score=81.27 TRINITY_DN3850_c0_g1_i2:35-2548(-)
MLPIALVVLGLIGFVDALACPPIPLVTLRSGSYGGIVHDIISHSNGDISVPITITPLASPMKSFWIDKYSLQGSSWVLVSNPIPPQMRDFSDIKIVGEKVYCTHTNGIQIFNATSPTYWTDGPIENITFVGPFAGVQRMFINEARAEIYLYNSFKTVICDSALGFKNDIAVGGDLMMDINFNDTDSFAFIAYPYIKIVCAQVPCLGSATKTISIGHQATRMKRSSDSKYLYVMDPTHFSVFQLPAGNRVYNYTIDGSWPFCDIENLPDPNNIAIGWSDGVLTYEPYLNPSSLSDYISYGDMAFLSINVMKVRLTPPAMLFYSDSYQLATYCVSGHNGSITTGSVTSGAITTRSITTRSVTTKDITTRYLTTKSITTGSMMTTGELTTIYTGVVEITTEMISTGRITTGLITTGKITTGLITTGQITTGLITTGRITAGLITTGTNLPPCGGTGVQCANGNCEPTASLCVPNECTIAPNLFRCSDESCAATPFTCPPQCTSTSLCWDGSCFDANSQCPIFPGCPALHRRCSDGSCVSSTESCESQSTCPSNQKSCPDGSCVGDLSECEEFNGCHKDQFQCLDGSCADDISGCLCENSNYKCVLDRCATTCPGSPIMAKPTSLLYLDDPASGPRQLDIVAENPATAGRTNLGSITIFPNDGARPQYSVQVGGVADSVIRNATLPSGHVIISSVVKWEVKGDATAIREDVTIELNIDESVPTSDFSKFCLATMARGEWKCTKSNLEGRTSTDGNFVRGTATGRGGDYSVLFSSRSESSSVVSDPENRTVMIASVTAVCLAVVVVAISFGVIVVIRRRRRREEEEGLGVSLKTLDRNSTMH